MITRYILKGLSMISDELHEILDSESFTEEEVYALTFDKFVPRVMDILPNFQWYNPDAGYLEDVQEFVYSLDNKILTIENTL